MEIAIKYHYLMSAKLLTKKNIELNPFDLIIKYLIERNEYKEEYKIELIQIQKELSK